ncbi:Acyltransferase [Popillia japonica]|uniref:Acyltransferase n=1 Tax=Popillia japonica TaxID=7064 RepID=A0AAW1L667_POPJA
MAALIVVLSVVGSILLTPFLMILVSIIFLASIGKSLGVRRLYIKLLLMIFEYGRINIEVAQRKVRKDDSDEEDMDVSPETGQESKLEIKESIPQGNSVPNGVVTNGYFNHNSTSLINRQDNLILLPEPPKIPNPPHHDTDITEASLNKDDNVVKHFELSTCFDYIKAGMEAIIEDQVTSRFVAEELKNWNLLTRTNMNYEFISWRLTFIWMCGFVVRYFFLFPLRVIICCFGVLWLTICTAMVGYAPDGPFKAWLNSKVSIMCFGILSSALSSVITYHNKENAPKNGICVANHTSPIDVLMLMCDNCYSLIGQRHGGFLGVVQRALARASPHIWFERSEAKDRHAVAARLKEHVSNPNNPPILIFPEGTCINNTSVMQFKKGSFEVDSVIYPVAIKYDPRFGDAFWDSSRYSYIQYLYMMMTSWAIVCEVWYLPPMYRKEGENAIDFANRVKSVIAKQGGLVDLVWDGQLKRIKPKKEWKERQQEEFR